jgi:hypothetical protein
MIPAYSVTQYCSHRLTASLIELLLFCDNAPRHRVLTAFVEYQTEFEINDAIDLESKESPIPSALMAKIKGYTPLTSIKEVLFDTSCQYPVPSQSSLDN